MPPATPRRLPPVPPMEVFRVRVLRVVALIPPGRVATYGQVAALAGAPRRARHVGRVLATLPPGHDLPWYRVLNAQGRVSARGGESRDDARREGREPEREQQRLLAAEGVRFRRGQVDLARCRWRPEEAGGALSALLVAEEDLDAPEDEAAGQEPPVLAQLRERLETEGWDEEP